MSNLLQRTAAELANPTTTTVTVLRYTQIRTDGGTQMRGGLNEETAGEYADELRRGGLLPPVIVFFDGSEYWLGDGFHRVRAHFMAAGNAAQIPAEVRPGTRRDAVLCAAGANAVHGLRRTNADKRRAVETLLRDEDWGKWSDREIARKCHVSAMFVGNVRGEIAPESAADTVNGLQYERTFTHPKTGQPTTMNTSGQREAAQTRNADSRSAKLVQKFGWGFSHNPRPPHGDGRVTVNMPCGLGTLGTFDDHEAALDAAEAAQKSQAIPVDLPARLVGTCRVVSDGVRYHAQAVGGGKGPRRRTFDSAGQALAWLEAESGLLISLPADLPAARCSIRPFGDGFMACWINNSGTTQANFESVDEAVAWLRKKVNGPTPSPLAAHLDHIDQVMAAEVEAMLADDAPADAPEPQPCPAYVQRSEAILAEVEFWRVAGNRGERVGELTGQYTVVAPLRRAIEEIVRVLGKELMP